MRRRIERVLHASEQAILPSHDQFARDRKCYFRARNSSITANERSMPAVTPAAVQNFLSRTYSEPLRARRLRRSAAVES